MSQAPQSFKSSQFNILLLGDGGVGKTALIKKHMSKEFERRYFPTVGMKETSLSFHTKSEEIVFKIWDSAGQEKFGGLIEEYRNRADAVILMFDVLSEQSYKNVQQWHSDISKVCKDIPIVLCANKVDVKNHKVDPKNVSFHIGKSNMQFYEISVKNGYHHEEPFLWLARRLTGDDRILFKS